MVLIRSLIISRVIVNKTKKNHYSLVEKKNSIQIQRNSKRFYKGFLEISCSIQAKLLSWRLQSTNKELNYEKCFVHPLVDYKLKPGFKVFNISLDEV